MPSDIRVNPFDLNVESSLALSAVFGQYKDANYFLSKRYPILLNGKQVTAELNQRYYTCVTAIPELGWHKKTYIMRAPNHFANGVFGRVYESPGAIKMQNNRAHLASSKYQKIIKEVKKEHPADGNREAILQFDRAKYTHTKKVRINEGAKSSDYSVIISRRFSGVDLDKQVSTMTLQERLTAAVSMVKKYILQIEDNRLVHYDVKIANFIYDKASRRGNYIDFGFAEKSELPMTNYSGSPLYQSYESLHNALAKEKQDKFKGSQVEWHPTDKRTDYFSLAHSLQELLADPAIFYINNVFGSANEYIDVVDAIYNHPQDNNQATIWNEQEQALQFYNQASLFFAKPQNLPLNEFKNVVNRENEKLAWQIPDQFASRLEEEDKNTIRAHIKAMLSYSLNARPVSLNGLLKALFCSQLKIQLNSQGKVLEGNELRECVNVILKTFHDLRMVKIDHPQEMQSIILRGLAALPDDKVMLDVFTDFLELDGLPVYDTKQALYANIQAVFDRYDAAYNKLVDYLQITAYLISERRAKEQADSPILNELYMVIYNQLERPKRGANHFNELSNLADNWQNKKLNYISDELNGYFQNNPYGKAFDVNSLPNPVDIAPNDIKQVKQGLRVLYQYSSKETVERLDYYRHYAGLLMKNKLSLFDIESQFFYSQVVPSIKQFSQFYTLHKAIANLNDCKVMKEFIIALQDYVEKNLLLPLFSNGRSFCNSDGIAIRLTQIEKVLQSLQSVSNDSDCRKVVQSLLPQLDPVLKSLVPASLFVTPSVAQQGYFKLHPAKNVVSDLKQYLSVPNATQKTHF